jgi:hypothetical protein
MAFWIQIDEPKLGPGDLIARAVARYEKKYGAQPTVVRVNIGFPSLEENGLGVKVVRLKRVLPDCFEIEDENGQKTSHWGNARQERAGAGDGSGDPAIG